MAFSVRLPQSEYRLLCILFVAFLLTRLPLLGYMPLVKDEAVYAIMVEEQADHLTLVPTFLGYPVNWKPLVFFWAYSQSVHLPIPLPLEASYRVPSLVFSLLAIPVLYRTMRNLGSTQPLAFFTTLVFLISMPSINPSVSLLTDSLNFLLISSSLWLYTEPKLGRWRFIAAGALSFAAFFTKLVIAFMIPILALAYFYFNERRTLKSPLLILSLLFVPAAYLANMALLDSMGMGGDAYSAAFGGHVAVWEQLWRQMGILIGSVTVFMLGAGIWFALSIVGLITHWRREKFMACWFAMVIFPLLTGTYMIWYYLPVMPAISYFAVLLLIRWDGLDKMDKFFAIFFSAMLLLTTAMVAYVYIINHEFYIAEKEAGLLIAGHENVSIVGVYAPTIVATKELTELREGGRMLDFGWVVSSGTFSEDEVRSFAMDYWSDEYPAVQGDFNGFFSNFTTYRKDTNITDFDYLVITGEYPVSPPGSALIYNRSNITIYRIG
jgi:hypothetical protein